MHMALFYFVSLYWYYFSQQNHMGFTHARNGDFTGTERITVAVKQLW